MRRLTCLLVFALFLTLPAAAFVQEQPSCRFRLAAAVLVEPDVWKLSPDDRDLWNYWPGEAKEWWLKDGEQKFPEFCAAPLEEADFVLSWESLWAPLESRTKTYRKSALRNDCYRSSIDPAGYYCKWVRVLPVLTNTVWEGTLERISVTVYRVGAEGREFTPVASITKERLAGLKPGKAAFERAMKALRREIRNNATTKPRQ